MQEGLNVILVTAASIGFLHTLMGPDHYLPFIALGRARNWGAGRVLATTVVCGVAHVLSSIVIGGIGIAVGIGVSRLEGFEGLRGGLASYLLLGFGLAYLAWGVKRAVAERPHTHTHDHGEGGKHVHHHSHIGGHSHVHQKQDSSFWWLFIIFILGPCEPLIPILMVPAARHSVMGVVLVSLVFGLVTVVTMTVVVLIAHLGLGQFRVPFLERYAHAIAGGVIALSGAAMVFLGL